MDGFEEPKRTHGDGIGGVLGNFKADFYVTLGPEVVDLVGADVIEESGEGAAIGKVGVVQEKAGAGRVYVLIYVIDAVGVEAGGAAFQAMDLVAFVEEQLGEIRAILAGYARDECAFHECG
jgi:hypothetical protein